MNELDKLLHQPIRTRIMSLLIGSDSVDYKTLKKELGLTDGHMTTHMRELIANNCVKVKKAFVDNKPKTTYKVTSVGKKRFSEYVESLKQIIALN